MKSLAKKLTEIRLEKGFTQEELAEKAKINLRTIQRIETSESKPRGKTLKLICEALDIEAKEIISNESSLRAKYYSTLIVNGLFLIALNLVLVGIIGFLTIDSHANINSLFGGFLLSIFIPLLIVILTKHMTRIERLLKFGLGYLTYFILMMILHGFAIGFSSGLFPCLLVSVAVLYFGNELISFRKTQHN